MSMDVIQLPKNEEDAYLSVVDGYDVEITGKKGKMVVQKTADDRQYEVWDSKNDKTSKPFKYPIEAYNLACKMVGGFLDWKILE